MKKSEINRRVKHDLLDAMFCRAEYWREVSVFAYDHEALDKLSSEERADFEKTVDEVFEKTIQSVLRKLNWNL